jgi:hypothetical protein
MTTPVEARLGSIERVHRVRRSLRRGTMVFAVALAMAAVVLWTYGAYRAVLAYTEYGPLLVGRWISPPLFAGLACAAGAGWAALRAWRTSRMRIRLHQHGLAILRGKRGKALAWADVLALWSHVERTGFPRFAGPRRHRLDLEATDRRHVRLDDSLEEFEALAAAVKSHVYPTLLEAYSRAFNERQPLAFGALTLSQSGIKDGRRSALTWSEISGARLHAGRLLIQTTRSGSEATRAVRVDRIPNVELCAQLIEEIRQTS